jgi:hypothetical protein
VQRRLEIPSLSKPLIWSLQTDGWQGISEVAKRAVQRYFYDGGDYSFVFPQDGPFGKEC